MQDLLTFSQSQLYNRAKIQIYLETDSFFQNCFTFLQADISAQLLYFGNNVKNRMMNSQKSNNFINGMLINGVCGVSAVSIQTFTLMWAHTLVKQQKKCGTQLLSLARNLYQKGGLKSFYKGAKNTWIMASLARFGDTAINFCVLNYFSQDNFLSRTPLFLQTGITWLAASAWRLALMPVALLTQENRKNNDHNNPYKKLVIKMARTYKKQTRGDIISLYSWFLSLNYLDKYLPDSTFRQSQLLAAVRYSFIGFISMISLDICIGAYRALFYKQSGEKKELCNILLGEGKNRTLIKGFHGIIFCMSSHFLKEKFQQIIME